MYSEGKTTEFFKDILLCVTYQGSSTAQNSADQCKERKENEELIYSILYTSKKRTVGVLQQQ